MHFGSKDVSCSYAIPNPTQVISAIKNGISSPVYLMLMDKDAPQREHSLREVFNGLRWFVRAGASWRMMPHDLPPWHTIYQQTQRWIKAGVFEFIVHDLRALLRLSEGRKKEPTAAILDSRTLQSTPESGSRAGYDGAKRNVATKSILPLIRWDIFWLCMSPLLTSRIASRSNCW